MEHIISPNKIIGSLVYRTREALNNDASFMEIIKNYEFYPSCVYKDSFSLWHYPGTPNEISNVLIAMNKGKEGSKLKFPSVFNFQSIRQNKNGNSLTIYYNLAFVAPVVSTWLTQEREEQVFKPILRPIYEEFFRQITKSGYFRSAYGFIPHDYYEVFTTGNNQDELIKGRYGDFIDAIEVHNIGLTIKRLCQKDLDTIEHENNLVTEKFK